MSGSSDFLNTAHPVLELRLDDEPIMLSGSVTIGRHLDNDLIVAGEDVLDYHARVTLTDRAVTLHPLLDATVIVNEVTLDQPVGIVPGDRILIGASKLSVAVIDEGPDTETGWHLHQTSGPDAIRLQRTQTVGRDDEADIQIADDHVSRSHARITVDRYVWVSDLDSANGTFINGERLVGGARLFHGDYLSFDAHRYQLVGTAPDLTPVRLEGDDPELAPLPSLDEPEIRSDTTVIGAVDLESAVQAPVILSDTQLPDEAGSGAFFVGASEPIVGEIFRPKIGRCIMGRSAGCDLIVVDQTVSLEHAEVVTRAEGCTLTNLMATNGTRINGDLIQSQRLQDGDIVRLGQVSLIYKEVPVREVGQRFQGTLLLGLLLLGVVAVLTYLLALD